MRYKDKGISEEQVTYRNSNEIFVIGQKLKEQNLKTTVQVVLLANKFSTASQQPCRFVRWGFLEFWQVWDIMFRPRISVRRVHVIRIYGKYCPADPTLIVCWSVPNPTLLHLTNFTFSSGAKYGARLFPETQKSLLLCVFSFTNSKSVCEVWGCNAQTLLYSKKHF